MGESLAAKAWGSLKAVIAPASSKSLDSPRGSSPTRGSSPARREPQGSDAPRLSGEHPQGVLTPAEVEGLPPLKSSSQNGSLEPAGSLQPADSRRSSGWFSPLNSLSSSSHRRVRFLPSRRSNNSDPDLQPQTASLQGSSADGDPLDRRKSGGWLRKTLSRRSSLSRRKSTSQPTSQPVSPSLASAKEKPATENGTANGKQQGGEGEQQEGGDRKHQEGGRKKSPREEFLEAYDAATLRLCNTLGDREAARIADTGFREVAPWNRIPGYLGHLEEHQERALSEMRSTFPASRDWHTDHDILRFLRAREFDIARTKEMYQKYIDEYRGRSMISPNPPIRPTHGPYPMELLEAFPQRESALTERLRKLMDWFLHTAAVGLDKDGRPVVYFRPCDILKNNMSKIVPVEDRVCFQSSANEMLLLLTKMASYRAGFHIDNITQVLDLSGMSALQMVSHMRSPESQKEWQHNQDFMPEVLHKVYIICAPSGMPLIWKVASPFLPVATRKKVEILGAGYVKTLQQVIGKENLPSCYGGDHKFEWQDHRKVKELKY